jgi:DNA-binding PadR family transcriptional regulator
MNALQIRLLKLIKANDGQFSWYQLDRAVSTERVEGVGNLMHVLKSLQSDGLISSREGANPAQPTYSITNEGMNALRGPTGS